MHDSASQTVFRRVNGFLQPCNTLQVTSISDAKDHLAIPAWFLCNVCHENYPQVACINKLQSGEYGRFGGHAKNRAITASQTAERAIREGIDWHPGVRVNSCMLTHVLKCMN